MGLPEAKTPTSRAELSQVGNISSPSVLFILGELLENADHHNTVKLMAYGVGLADFCLQPPAKCSCRRGKDSPATARRSSWNTVVIPLSRHPQQLRHGWHGVAAPAA